MWNYSEKLKFQKDQYTHDRRNRRGNIIWYNPPFSKNVKTNIVKQLLRLLDKHFGKNYKNHKVFNCNDVKTCYCYIDMKNVISSHNKKINSYNETNGKTSYCKNKSNFPLDNKCLINKS